MRLPKSIKALSGRRLSYEDPHPSQFDIQDIASALANNCRFGGQCWPFLSVAEHCVHVSHHVPPQYAMLGLMHDAQEAYVGDLPKPLKEMCDDFQAIENRLWRSLACAYDLVPGTDFELPPEVKVVDRAMFVTEAFVVHPELAKELDIDDAIVTSIHCWPPAAARREFLMRFNQLVKEMGTQWPNMTI